VTCEADRDLLDALIHLSKEGLVLRDALLPRIHPALILTDSARLKHASVSGSNIKGIRPPLMQRSVERAAENESTFRRLNEALEEKATELGLGDERTPYLCECENERCTEVILLTRVQYETVRANPRAFVVVPGHQEGDETVLQEEEAFMVIEKTGEEGTLVAEQDPRA
jgi:hypothetical protein